MKAEKALEKNIAEQLEARRAKNKATRERKIAPRGAPRRRRRRRAQAAEAKKS